MTCYKPLQAWQTPEGVFFCEHKAKGNGKPIQLACGQCMGCKLKYSTDWATRCMHESQLHWENCFITLTYNEANLPYRNQLTHRDVQLFLKRLRKATGKKILYYMGGEYGDKGRPHYHMGIFGHDFHDKLYLKTTPSGETIYTSETLSKLWGKGYTSVGALTWQSAAYIARYCTSKVTGDLAKTHYKRTDKDGDYMLTPEYSAMSTKPAIGRIWLELYGADVWNYDHAIVNGHPVTVPKYYDRVLKRKNPDKLSDFKAARELEALKHRTNQTPERLAVREQVQIERIKSLNRRNLNEGLNSGI